MKENFQKTVLPNGLRVVTERIPHFHSATIGIWVDVGSTDEDDLNHGISHFLEHVMFKGTPTRTAKEIAERMDGIGGNLNAFTEKEQTCFYAKVMDKHIPLAMEIMGDMILHSHFPEEEVEREKMVVLEEIKMYEDSPDEVVFDMITQTTWENHPLGKSILGTEQSVSRLNRAMILDFVKRFYSPRRIIISIAGRIKHEEILKMVGKNFPFPSSPNGSARTLSPPDFKASKLFKYKEIEQAHFCLAMKGIPQKDERRYALLLLDTILGGSASSRLFQEIREKRGLAYTISTFQGAYANSAIFGVYGASSPTNFPSLVKCLLEILSEIREKGVTRKELTTAKEHLKGSLSLTLESASNRMIRMAKNEVYHERFVTHKEMIEQIHAVTLKDIQMMAGECLKLESSSWAVLGPLREDSMGIK